MTDKQLEALAEGKQDMGCPCLYLDEPCHPSCTCRNGVSSAGCLYCCTYGSIEQRKQKALQLKEMYNAGAKEPTAQPTEVYVARDEIDGFGLFEFTTEGRVFKGFLKPTKAILIPE